MLDIITYIIFGTIRVLASALCLLMFARSIISLFASEKTEKILFFLTAVTEPVIYPVRLLFDALNINSDIPIDIPYMVTFLLLILIETFCGLII